MTKVNSNKKEIQKSVELGKRNKLLIPRVKTWCKHIHIEDRSAGLITEMYNVPTNLSISCPHTHRGFTAFHFESIARDFILENCLQCKYHEEIHEKNFGREIIELKKKWDEEILREKEEIARTKTLFKEQVKAIKHEDSTTITELSIIKIIDEIESNKIEKSLEILEASKLSPLFFNNISIDYLCLFLDENDIDRHIIESIYNVSKVRVNFSNFAIERLLDSIKNKINDDVSAILLNILSNKWLEENKDFVISIVDNLQYERQMGDYYDKKYSYPHSIELIFKIYSLNKETLQKHIKNRLFVNNKLTRINTNGLLQELIERDFTIVKEFIEELFFSLELDDDGYNESADNFTCKTLFLLYEKDSTFVKNNLIKCLNRLSKGAIIELLVLFEKIIIKGNKEDSQELLLIVIGFISNKTENTDVVKASINIIKEVTEERLELIDNDFNSLTGILIHLFERIKSYNHYKEEISTNIVSTFNPLQNLDPYEIETLKFTFNNNFSQLKDIIEFFISKDKSLNSLRHIISIIKELDSKKDGQLKGIFISLLKDASNDPSFIADFLPQIHSYILDIDSLDVRFEGMNFLIKIFDKFPQLITQSFIDIIKVFLNDVDLVIRKKALEVYYFILKHYPEQVTNQDIETICKCQTNNYIIIHQEANKLSYRIFTFLTPKQREQWYINLISWESSYFKNENLEYSKNLVNIILFYSKEMNIQFHDNVTKLYYEKYCDSNYYIAIEFIKKLNNIAQTNTNLIEFWLVQSLKFIGKLKVDSFYSHEDIIAPFFNTLYYQTSSLIIQNDKLFSDFIVTRIKVSDYRTILKLLRVFAYYSLHEVLNRNCHLLKENIPVVKSNNYLLKQINIFQSIAQQELNIKH
ncbi:MULTISPECIES: hypothetical protein [unclassified Arcicella]|uniref:hypothetical protein n=1 Tax=unclassified Arcicella TaxID=2644986 RepID=UPI00285C8B2A|nr:MULTISPECIES: hypothetical protein [unclassified Arcicella]MDR6564190.1 hypothetical protein [Arcicella sp. BE51]MDR6811564.1 hypothetical protein [Arcicella sp. BE140]MDR6823090.1 hypothetical protein [Arcicella sp. BE139]